MKITVTAEKPIDDKVAATVTVPAADVDKAIAKTYKDIAKKYNFQGFRRGHAPRPVIDGIIGRESVLAQATNDLLNAVEPMMLEELDVTPGGLIADANVLPCFVVSRRHHGEKCSVGTLFGDSASVHAPSPPGSL